MIEALLLNDEVRSYFEGQGRDDRFALEPLGQVTHAVEALKATTRLMHISAWLMSRRSRLAVDEGPPKSSPARLGKVEASEGNALSLLPEEAQRLIGATLELFERVKRLDKRFSTFEAISHSPTQFMQRAIEQRLAASLLS